LGFSDDLTAAMVSPPGRKFKVQSSKLVSGGKVKRIPPPDAPGPVAIKGLFSVAAGLRLRLHRLESLCHHFTATF